MACTLGTKSPKVVGNGGTCERSINDIGLLSSCYIGDLSYEEISTVSRVPVGTAIC
jgi:hypothetical protein